MANEDTPTLTLIKDQLNTLEEDQAVTRGQLNDIMTVLTTDRTAFDKYSESMSRGLPAVTQGVINLVYAKQSGDPLYISIASLGTFSGFLTMATPMLGPAGTLVSALSSMVATILGAFLPEPPSLKQEVEDLLNKFQAEGIEFDLGAAADQIQVFIETLEKKDKKTKKPIPVAWKPLELVDGSQIKAIDLAWQWLAKPKKQSLPYWGELLSKTSEVFSQLLRAVAETLVYPSKIAKMYDDINGEPITPSELATVSLEPRCRMFLDRAREIKPVVQNRGMLFLWNKSGDLWAGDHLNEGTNAHLGGACTAVAVAVSQREVGWASRAYHLLRVENGTVRHWELRPPYAAASPGITFLMNGISDVWGMVGGDQRLVTYVNRPGTYTKGKDLIYFYTVKGRTIHGWSRDNEERTVIDFYTQDVNVPELKWVRVVQGPEAVDGDPDDRTGSKELPGILRNVDYLVYGGNQSVLDTPRWKTRGDYIYVDSRRSPRGKERIRKDGFVPGPWKGAYYYGLGVTQRYVWVHAPLGFACATHASVMRCLEGEIEEPTWMFHYMRDHPSLGTSTDPKGRIMDLCPSDDGSLVVCLTEGDPSSADGAPLHTAAYHVNLKSRYIALQRWTRCGAGAAAYRTCKVPLFCWPWLQGLMEFVEQTYPKHADTPTDTPIGLGEGGG